MEFREMFSKSVFLLPKSPKFMSLEPGDEFGLDDVVSGSTALVMLLACKR